MRESLLFLGIGVLVLAGAFVLTQTPEQESGSTAQLGVLENKSETTQLTEPVKQKIIAAQIDEKQNLHVLLESGKTVTLSPMQRMMLQNPLGNYRMFKALGYGG